MSRELRPEGEVIEVEVVDLEPRQSGPASTVAPPPAGRRPPWLLAVFLVGLAMAGLALIPGLNRPPLEAINPDSTLESLDEPVIATTSTTIPRLAVAVMSDDVTELIPTQGLEGFLALAGPIEFGGRWWLAGNPDIYSSRVSILSTSDGVDWTLEAAIDPGDGEWLRVDDLGVFGGVLMAVGTIGETVGPDFAPSTAGNITLWKSSDGIRWSALQVAPEDGMSHMSLEVTTGSEEVLIAGWEDVGFDAGDLASIPPDLIPGLERGDLQLWTNYDTIHIYAPPRLELAVIRRLDAPQPPTGSSTFKSEDLMVWRELVGDIAIPTSAVPFGDGFVGSNANGQLVISDDAESWRRSDRFPDLWYDPWKGGLVALFHQGTSRLVIADEAGFTRVALPPELAVGQGLGTLVGGSTGLAIVRQASMPNTTTETAETDLFSISTRNGYLLIEEPSGEMHRVTFDTNGRMTGTYVPETDSVRVETVEDDGSFDLPLVALQELRWQNSKSGWEIAVSPDGLLWTGSASQLSADWIAIPGQAGNRFLISSVSYSPNYNRVVGLTVYATGPVS